MGSIIGGLIGGIGSIIAGSQASKTALTGFNYDKKALNPYVGVGQDANNALAQLLGLAPESTGTKNAFSNYLNSSGYNFMMQQGQQAITGSAAARGILNSGSTAKALTSYGTNLASTYYNNYLNQLMGLSGEGLQAGVATGQAGTQGGATAAQAQFGGIAGATGAAQATVNPLINFFGGI